MEQNWGLFYTRILYNVIPFTFPGRICPCSPMLTPMGVITVYFINRTPTLPHYATWPWLLPQIACEQARRKKNNNELTVYVSGKFFTNYHHVSDKGVLRSTGRILANSTLQCIWQKLQDFTRRLRDAKSMASSQVVGAGELECALRGERR